MGLNAYALSIYVSGSDVHVVGEELNGSAYRAKYWKNGVAIDLTDGTKASTATSVYVLGNDVYVAGSEYNNGKSVAKYWKNGLAINLSDY